MKDTLERLSHLESPHPILSVYLDLSPEREERQSINPRLRDLLRPIEDRAASGELDHESSRALRTSARRVLEIAPDLEGMLGSGVAVFLCDPLGLEERLTMPREIWDCAVAGSTPYLRPLRAVIQWHRKIAVVTLDSRRAEIVTFRMGEALDRVVLEAEELRKTNLAGWYGLEEYRHRKHGEEARHRLFREVAEELDRLRRHGAIEIVFVGGQMEITSALMPFLDREVRAMSESFVIDLNNLTPARLAAEVAELGEEHERRRERQLVDEVYSLAASGSPSAIGLGQVLPAANRNAISTLLIHDAVTLAGAICATCGAISPHALVCPTCVENTEPVPDLFEAMARSVLESGGTVEHIKTGSKLAEDSCAAWLRYTA